MIQWGWAIIGLSQPTADSATLFLAWLWTLIHNAQQVIPH